MELGVSESTRRSYFTAWKCFLSYCAAAGSPACPPSRSVLQGFTAWMWDCGFRSSTAINYMSGVRYGYLCSGYDVEQISHPSQKLLLRAFKRHRSAPLRCRGYVTVPLLRLISGVHTVHDDVDACCWAVMSVAVFGCFRLGELVPQTTRTPPPLLFKDFVFTGQGSSTTCSVTLRRSKADPFGSGSTVSLCCVDDVVCPVCALLRWFKRCQLLPHLPAFCPAGRPLTATAVVRTLRSCLQRLGLPAMDYSGHSFRRGSATSAAAAGMPDSDIQLLGRWSSNCFRRYVDPEVRAGPCFSRILAEHGL
jgi:hypothetical protein